MTATQKEISTFITTYQQNPCFHALIDDIASRERHYKSVSVDRQMERLAGKGRTFSRREVIDAMRLFDDFGLSTFLIGRRGAASRMEWEQ